MSTTLSISELAKLLTEGELLRDVCPFCCGGASGEVSFSMRREQNTARYKCFRATCNASGKYIYKGDQVIRNASGAPPDIHAKRYALPSLPLDVSMASYLGYKFQIPRQTLLHYTFASTADNRLIIPIRDVMGRVVGEELKNYPIVSCNHGALKTQILVDKGVPVMSWYNRSYPLVNGQDSIQPDATTLVIVEDQISAVKASILCHSVALLGVGLTVDKIAEIADVGYKSVLLALDSDAFTASVRNFRNAHALIDNLRIVRLTKDIKDMEYHDIRKTIAK